MRSLILVAAAALAVSACGNNDQADNSQNVDENLAAENIVANDVTAIDAVTADAANMAADMNYEALDENLDDAAGNGATAKPRPARKPSVKTTQSPAANSAADATTNAD